MAKGNYKRSSEPHGSAAFEPMFETNFASDENSMMDFKNESFGSDWDANRPFEQDIISPSSLHSFNGPRNATDVHSKWINASSSKEFDQFDKGKKTYTAEPSPRIVADSLPFRDRFASAAMVSQQANASFQLEESFRSQEDISPKKLFSTPIGDKSSGPLSPVHNNDAEYVSFGNQSVFSDITDFEMSVNASYPSPSRDLRRKARESRNTANRSPPRQHLGKVPEEESTKGTRRTSDKSTESESDQDNEKNISVRLASFFANRSISNSSSKEQGEGRNLPLRHRGISGNPPTPPGSASESSNGYIAWPGTLDQNDNTVIENSSYASAEDISNSRQSLPSYNKAADATARKWVEQNTNSVPEKQRTNVTTVEPNRNDKIWEDQPVVSSARSRVAELKKRFEERNRKKEEATSTKDIVDLDVVPTDPELPTPSDYHLAAAISKAKSSSKSYRLDISFDSTIPEDEVVDLDEYNLNDSFLGSIATDDEDAEDRQAGEPNIDTSASLRRVQSAGKSFANIIKKKGPLHQFKSPSSAVNSEPIRLSEAALRQTDQLTSTFQTVAHGANVKGYRGFLNKTADVPNLMDDLESVTSASTVATNRKHDHLDSGSDVFDGVCSDSSAGGNKPQSPTFQRLMQRKQIIPPASNRDCTSINIVQLNGTISSIQTSPAAFEARKTSVEFDATLTESDTDYAQSSRRLRGGNAIRSGQIRHHLDDESASYSSQSALNSQSTDISISNDLSSYAVGAGQVRKLVKAYRNMSQFVNGDNISQKEEDAKKAFALFEMRSRIMATDIERGFDRAGGTVTVDDLVLTQYFRASCRVRDAVIVSKAWRDGASPQDARTALNLIEGHEYYIKRSSRLISSTDSETSDSQESFDSTCSKIQISYERVDWIDDTEFSLIRCLGANTLRGSGIFTVGDCQSMLLKLTHEHCEVSSYFPRYYFTNRVLSSVLY